MSAAIQLVNPQVTQEGTAETQLGNVTSFDSALEQKLRRALNYVSELQAEVKALREELTRSERACAHKETLLRNAALREQELRAELVKGCF